MSTDDAEVWRAVVGYEGRYEVSSLGRVRSLATMKPLTYFPMYGYMRVSLRSADGRATKKVHRLVCEAFHGPPNSQRGHVDHIDCDKANNRADNLRWVSQSENNARARWRTGSSHPRPNAKITEADVIDIRARRANGERLKDLALQFGLSVQQISAIACRSKWQHIA